LAPPAVGVRVVPVESASPCSCSFPSVTAVTGVLVKWLVMGCLAIVGGLLAAGFLPPFAGVFFAGAFFAGVFFAFLSPFSFFFLLALV
jgi:hypothetical protein